MKCKTAVKAMEKALSLPVRGAWIEINSVSRELIEALSSLPVRGAWIEIWSCRW